jgi:pimeloyl-ACP methyl ester carboxylesterase
MEMEQHRYNEGRSGIHGRDSGNHAAATVLVYLPGLGQGGDVFEGLVSAKPLAGFRHIVLDYVDWSKPTPPGETISLPAVADLIADWLVAHVPRPVVLVGHSLGGVIAQLIAERHPARVAKLVDIEGNLSSHDCSFSGKAVAYELEAFIDHGFAERKNALMEAADPPTLRYAEGLAACDPSTYHAYAKPLVRISEEETLAPRLAALPMPVLYIHGQDAQRGLSGRSLEMLSRAGVRVAAIGHAGHWPYLEDLGPFVGVLLGFIELLRARG